MAKILGTPKNGWTYFTFGPFAVEGISYFTEVHWDMMDFFGDCITSGVGILEFDCEDKGKYLLTFSSFGMELRNEMGSVQSWFPSATDIQTGANRLLIDIIQDFNAWIYWSAQDEKAVKTAAEDLAINLETYCTTLINTGVLNTKISDIIPSYILDIAHHGKRNIVAQTENEEKWSQVMRKPRIDQIPENYSGVALETMKAQQVSYQQTTHQYPHPHQNIHQNQNYGMGVPSQPMSAMSNPSQMMPMKMDVNIDNNDMTTLGGGFSHPSMQMEQLVSSSGFSGGVENNFMMEDNGNIVQSSYHQNMSDAMIQQMDEKMRKSGYKR